MVVKKVGVFSVAKISGSVYFVIGFIAGLFIALASLLGGLAGLSQDSEAGFIGIIFGVGAIIILPFFYGILGFLGGAICGALYNFFSSVVGGIELEVE